MSHMEDTAARPDLDQPPQGGAQPKRVSTAFAAEDMGWEEMTVDEYAQQEMGAGLKLRRVNGLWWHEVRPFFYRPLFPFAWFVPGDFRPPRWSMLVGYHHPVPARKYANSEMRLLVFDDLKRYSLEQLPNAYRKNTRKGLKHFEIQPIRNLRQFIGEAFKVYLSFHDRTGWEYKEERTDPAQFTRWAESLFAAPKTKVWGAFAEGRLRGVTISFRVENVIISPTYFADTEALRLRISEAMLHVLRAQAAQAPGAQYLYLGMAGSKNSLDQFKMSRGCQLLTLPAYCWLNPVVRAMAKRWRKQDYQRLFLRAEQMRQVSC